MLRILNKGAFGVHNKIRETHTRYTNRCLPRESERQGSRNSLVN